MTVLVQGATGGVATACILLSRLAGITVYATSRDEAKRAFAVDLGAELRPRWSVRLLAP